MTEVLLLPALLGALLSMLLCAVLDAVKRRPRAGVILGSALTTGVVMTVAAFGTQLLSLAFWTDGVKGGPAYLMVLIWFVLSTFAALVSASALVRFHCRRIERIAARTRSTLWINKN